MGWLVAGLAGSAALVLILAGGLAWFLRDPERQPPANPRAILAPADGQVLVVERATAPAFVAGPAWRIVTFLSIWDVHVQRAPGSGRVGLSESQVGGFAPAFAARAAKNHGHQLGLETPCGRVLVLRTAGLLARRVTTTVALGQQVQAGERIGRILLGSRVELFVPAKVVVGVRPGDRVRAGETVLANWDDADGAIDEADGAIDEADGHT
jgi:phosphatidylserine decarboxylase